MVSQYRKQAESLISDDWLSQVQEFYYNDFTDPNFPNLKFRFLKLYGYDAEKGTTMWFYLHRILNKRSLIDGSLKASIQHIIDKQIFPIRIFFSAAEWSYPYLIRGIKSRRTRYLSPGIIPLESDISLDVSHKVAKVLHRNLEGEKKFVFSGNKSIHVWLYNLKSDVRTIDEDLTLRKKIFFEAQSLTPIELDYRTTVDSYRVLPVLGSLNGFTMKLVRELSPNEL